MLITLPVKLNHKTSSLLAMFGKKKLPHATYSSSSPLVLHRDTETVDVQQPLTALAYIEINYDTTNESTFTAVLPRDMGTIGSDGHFLFHQDKKGEIHRLDTVKEYEPVTGMQIKQCGGDPIEILTYQFHMGAITFKTWHLDLARKMMIEQQSKYLPHGTCSTRIVICPTLKYMILINHRDITVRRPDLSITGHYYIQKWKCPSFKHAIFDPVTHTNPPQGRRALLVFDGVPEYLLIHLEPQFLECNANFNGSSSVVQTNENTNQPE